MPAAFLPTPPPYVQSRTTSAPLTVTRQPPTFLTASTGPPSINNASDALESTHCTLPLLTPSLLAAHAGFLVACYSDHPLVSALKLLTSKPVTGIFEASLSASLLLIGPEQGFGIVSTGKIWEELLGNGVGKYLGAEASRRFVGCETTGLNATDLHDVPVEEVREKMKEATKRLLRKGNVGAVCLGCAGMAGMDEMVREACVEELGEEEGRKVRVVDGVKVGFAMLEGLIQADSVN